MANSTCPMFENRKMAADDIIQKARETINQQNPQRKNLVWLELNGCSGNIISILDGEDPGFGYLLLEMTNFIYSNSLSFAEDGEATDQLLNMIGKDYILAVEGAVSRKDNGSYNIIAKKGNTPITGLEAAKMLGQNAAYVIAVGNCASYGGISAANPNPSDCTGIQSVIDKKVIKLTGCPCNPRWFMGTLAHILLYDEMPLLDKNDRPLLFYGDLIHDFCPRRTYFNQGIFAKKLGEKTCMFKLGCRGPVTRTDCPTGLWNSHTNWPVGSDTPCIGCAQFGFPDAMEPFISYDTYKGD